jgi:hypothetical protein
MLEIKYRDQDGEEGVFLTSHDYLWNDPKLAAEEIAEEDRSASGGDLYDMDCWPRDYEVFINEEWHSISVSMEYMPCFDSSVNERINHE